MAQSRASPPIFDQSFLNAFEALLEWRRDVRHFLPDPLPPGLLEGLVNATRWAPSVGYSQPSRFVRVDDPSRRSAIIAEFERCNAESAAEFEGEAQQHYTRLKLAGLREAPVHLAVFCDRKTQRGRGLGRKTMPETLAYSVVMAIYTLWLLARAQGIGVGWVSILEPTMVETILQTPPGWSFIAYLCLGYPKDEHHEPELYREGWEEPEAESTLILLR